MICARCVLPGTFPGVTFDSEGVCNHCRKANAADSEGTRESYERKFVALAGEHAGRAAYDVLMAYSGGKDSTYTLDVFARRYGLRVLALTFDNTFVSERAFVNMRNVCSALGVDHLVLRPDPEMLRRIFRAAAEKELFSLKSLERASTICTSCIGLVKAVVLRTAIEKAIPFVGFGWSPGQAPVQASVMRTNPSLVRATQRAISEPLRAVVGDGLRPYFLAEEHFERPERFPWNVHPLAFLEYDEEKVLERNRRLGWEKPDDTDANSTNCLLNALANQVHRERYGYNPYAWEIANMVRSGVMNREAGLGKTEAPEDRAMVEYGRSRLFDAVR
jgi:tRNA(Ile)-lysidine synthase TilS/MesJ